MIITKTTIFHSLPFLSQSLKREKHNFMTVIRLCRSRERIKSKKGRINSSNNGIQCDIGVRSALLTNQISHYYISRKICS